MVTTQLETPATYDSSQVDTSTSPVSSPETRSPRNWNFDQIPGTRYNLFGKARLPKIPKPEIVQLTTQLSIMIRSGVDLVSALESLARQASTEEGREVLNAIHEDVLTGNPFSVALRRFEFIFGASYVASVSAGEASGKMWQVLGQVAKLRGNSVKLQQKIQTLMAYPLALMTVSSLVVAALVFGVLPQFAEIFGTYGTDLPWITSVLINTSNMLTNQFWFWIPATIAFVVLGIRFLKGDIGRGMIDHLMLNLFLVREVTIALMVGRTTQLLGLLIESGVPLLESLRLVKESVHNRLFRKIFAEMEESVVVGNGLGGILASSKYVPSSAAEMLMTAEKTGTLATVTQLVGTHYEEEGEEKLKKLTAYMEPAITVGMGLVVAVIVLAVALPMFDLATIAQ